MAASYGNQECLFSNASDLGMFGCDSPLALIDSVIDQAYRLLPGSPFIVISGDFMRHDDDNRTQKLEVLGEVVAKLQKKFPESVLLPTVGNNDLWGHWEMNVSTEEPYDPTVSVPTNSWLSTVAEQWNLKNSSFCENAFYSFSYGGYYSCDIDDVNLTLIQLNSIPYSPKHNPNTTNMDDPFGQLAWLNSTLINLRERKRKAFLTSHVPWGVDAYGSDPPSQWQEKYTVKFLELMAEHDDIVKAQLFGHTHINNVRLPPKIYNVTSPLLITAAVSPIYHNYPTFRVMQVDKNELCVTGFEDWHLNISDPNVNTTDWKMFGNMQSEYRLPAGECFSVAAARLEFQNIWYNNTENWTEYMTYWAGGMGELSFENNIIYCSMMWVTQSEFNSCLIRLVVTKKKSLRWYIILVIVIACAISFPLFIWFFYKICKGDESLDLLAEPLNPKSNNRHRDDKFLGISATQFPSIQSPDLFVNKADNPGSLGTSSRKMDS